jgi:hypothetical protein
MIPLPIAWVAQDSGNVNQISRVKSAGFRSAALSLAFTNQNAVDQFKNNGIFTIVEGVIGPATTIPAGAQALIAQVETDFQRDSAAAALQAGLGAGIPVGIGTTYGGLDTADGSAWKKIAPYVSDRIFVECYKADDPIHADIPRMLKQGAVYGIPSSLLIAVCGTFREEIPSDYTGLTATTYGGIYQIAQTQDDELDDWARFNLANSQPQPIPAPPDPVTVRAQASATLHTWLDPYAAQGKPQTLSIIRLADRLLKLTGSQQLDFNEQLLVTELDRVGSPRT